MQPPPEAPRLARLPLVSVAGLEVPVAVGVRARLLGLAFLDRGYAGPGLLIPRCASVHTFGMRFALDVAFLDDAGAVIDLRLGVGGNRFLSLRAASAVLEVPAGGDIPRRSG